MKNSQRGFIIPLVIAIIAILAIGGGVYIYQRNESRPESESINIVSQTNSATTTNSQGVITQTNFEIKELGIKFKLTDEIKDLTYVMSSDNKTASFSTKSLKLTGGNYCTASYGPIGSISANQDNLIARGELPTKDSDDFRKINNQWVYYTHPQATCSDNKEVQDLTIRQIKALQNAFKSVSFNF